MKNRSIYIGMALLLSNPLPLLAKRKGPSGAPTSSSTALRAVPVTCTACPNFTCTGSFTGGTGGTGTTGVICIGTGCTGCTPDTIPTICCVSVPENATVQGFLTVACQNVQGSLTVGLNADIKQQLVVNGNTNLLNNLCVEGDLAVGENALVEGSGVVVGELTVDSMTTLDDFLIVYNNKAVSGPVVVNGNQTIGGNVAENCNATINGLLTASGPVIVYNGQTINDGGLTVLTTGPTGPSGMTGPASVTIQGDVNVVDSQTVTNSVLVQADFTLDQSAIFNNVVTNGPLVTNGQVVANAGITIAGGDHTLNAGALTLNSGLLTVNGTASLQSKVTASQGAIIERLTVNEGETISTGNLDITTGSATISGLVTAGGPISSPNAATLGQLTLTNTTNSLGPTNGTLVVEGGVGVGRDLWLGGSQYFADVFTLGGNPAPLNYYEEANFATSFVFGGVTVSPLTSVGIKIVRVGDVVNLIIPALIINNPGTHIDVITSSTPLPLRFRPCTTIRGAASTIITSDGTTGGVGLTGQLGEFNVDPSGLITLGLPGAAISPQRFASTNIVEADINTITYNVACCNRSCATGPSTP